MAKKIHIKLLNDNNIILDTLASYKNNNNLITFTIDDMFHTLNIKEEILTRENDEYLFTLDIKKKKSTINLKKENYILHLNVEYAILFTNQNIYEISYRIETQDNDIKIILELEGE